jgi:hypothetical protein
VTVTEVNPARAAEVLPKDVEVVPNVIELLARELFGMLERDRAFELPRATEADPEMPPE